MYLYLVHTGAISRLLNAVGINMMGRDYIWSLAKPYYQFSPTFIGLGFEAVDVMVTRFYEIGLIDVATHCTTTSSRCSWSWGFRGCASGVRSCT